MVDVARRALLGIAVPALFIGDEGDLSTMMEPMAETIVADAATELAEERTLLAWIRTGLAIMGLGFVVARFGLFLREIALVKVHPAASSTGFSPIVGVLLIVLGVVAMVVAACRFVTSIKRLRRGEPAPIALAPGVFLTVGLALVGIALALYLLATSR